MFTIILIYISFTSKLQFSGSSKKNIIFIPHQINYFINVIKFQFLKFDLENHYNFRSQNFHYNCILAKINHLTLINFLSKNLDFLSKLISLARFAKHSSINY